ncbi:hypothetical protein [Embleya sp. NPDC059259]|uniref:hypothetical protein n=1 Tax=unclassified Embleya TaxID=2699296 RepID=UPI003683E255
MIRHRERTALIVDCDPASDRPVVLRPIDPHAPVIRLTRAEAQHLVDDTSVLLDLLDATADAPEADAAP